MPVHVNSTKYCKKLSNKLKTDKMNKYLIYAIMFGVLCVFGACTDDDTDTSIITDTNFDFESIDGDMTVEEENQVVEINFMFDENQIVPTSVTVSVDGEGSTATEGEDFNILTSSVSVPAYRRSGTVRIEILADLLAEGEEQVTFNIDGVNDPFGPQTDQKVTITITDKIYDEVQLTFNWDGEFQFGEDLFPICGNVDLDFLVFNEADELQAIYDAATGSCPEVLPVTSAWGDGVYTIKANLYENGLDSAALGGFLFMPPVEYVTQISIDKGGVFNETYTPDDYFNSNSDDFVHDDADNNIDILKVTVSGTTYRIETADGTLIAEGIAPPDPETE